MLDCFKAIIANVSMASTKLAQSAKTTILEFIADLRTGVCTRPADQGELLLVEFWFKKLHVLRVMEYVVGHVLPHKLKIEKRVKSFFITERDAIFKGLPQDRINYFADMVSKPEADGGISVESEQSIWAYFDTLVAIGEQYKKEK